MSDDAKIRVLVVDDEPHAREYLRLLLADDAGVELVGECADGYEAAAAVNEHAPDLVFLDVKMPEVDGFAVLDRLKVEPAPFVIFVTAYPERDHAARAFGVAAVDYLLKPFSPQRFKVALEKAKRHLAGQYEHVLTRAPQTGYLERVSVKVNERVFPFRAEEIDWVEAERRFVCLHIGGKSYRLKESMSAFESRLDPKRFARINRSEIVNVDRVRLLETLFHHDYYVVLHDDTRLKLTRNFSQRLAALLGCKL